jgi:hypothetical protein
MNIDLSLLDLGPVADATASHAVLISRQIAWWMLGFALGWSIAIPLWIIRLLRATSRIGD